ncbi:MAG: NAD(P)H-quinone oxidoreductase [Planctomycetia bacterium]|nr:NAD(P)H-quinone oxidoreductase [Planctomycetia bacterium]
MKACIITQPGDVHVLKIEPRPVPELQPGEVLIKVQAAGVNGADLLQRKGKYPVPPGVSAEIPGLEVAGIIEAIAGDVTSWKRGDKVAALLSGGGYAEYVAVPVGQCLPWPEIAMQPATPEQAAALPETCCTVWSNVFELARLQLGESILIHGGASGIGTTAIQMAKTHGCTVYCTVGKNDKRGMCLSLGASHVINYQTEDFVEKLMEFTTNKGVNVILDIVGGSYLSRNLAALTYQGRLVTIATRGGANGELDIGMMMRKQLTITGSLLRPRSIAEKSRLVEQVRQHVWPWVKAGKIRPVIDTCYPLDQASQAHARLESGSHVGKVILKVT